MTAVHTKGYAAAYSCENKEAKAPNPGHTSWNFPWEVVSFTSTDGADQLASVNEPLIVGDETLIGVVALVMEYLIGGDVVWVLVGVVGWRRWWVVAS